MEMPINTATPETMHVDLNSCFATVEQQANPLLRGKPLVVAAYATDKSCVLAPSIEAKTFGIKTGMRVFEAKQLCPSVKVLAPDPAKYRHVYKQFCKLFSQYTPDMHPKSIDEAVLYLEGTPIRKHKSMEEIGYEIKKRMREEIGDWLRCNVGIATNGSLAKLAAGLHKPDGLDIIEHTNVRQVFSAIDVRDFCGIDRRNAARLASVGIYTPLQFLDAPLQTLRAAFQSINGYYWYLRLRGWEIDNVQFRRRTIGHSYHLVRFTADIDQLSQMLYKLCEKMGRRLRGHNYGTQGIHLALLYTDGTYWHHGQKTERRLYTTKELFDEAVYLLKNQPEPKPVRILAVNCFNLFDWQPEQLSLFSEISRSIHLTNALDTINDRFGEFTVTSAKMLGMEHLMPDRIAFGQTDMTFKK